MKHKLWRRLAALGTALVTLWVVTVTAGSADLSDAVDAIRRENPAKLLLQWELPLFGDGLSLPAALVLGQSPALMSVRWDSRILSQSGSISHRDLSPARIPDYAGGELTFADNGVPSQTVIPNPAGYTAVNGVLIKNASNKTLDAALLSQPDFAAKLTDAAPQVLIMHTHGSECYSLPIGETCHSTGNYRSDDPEVSVIRVGDEIAATLSSYGISVLHDRTLHDDPYYEGAYERSAESIRTYLEKYPSITYVIDVHRDAVQDSSGKQYKLVSREDPNCAQISFVMGSNHEGWEENLKLAIAVSAAVSENHPTAMRPITLRNSNYNQHLSAGSMLVEIGAAGNSPDEAVQAGRVFAEGLAHAVLGSAGA